MVAAGPLEPVLRGLLTKDHAARTTEAQAREQLAAVAAGPQDRAPGRPRPRLGMRSPAGGDVVRFDLADLLSLASSSKAVLSTAVRDARDQVKEANERRHEPPLPRRERRASSQSDGTTKTDRSTRTSTAANSPSRTAVQALPCAS